MIFEYIFKNSKNRNLNELVITYLTEKNDSEHAQ